MVASAKDRALVFLKELEETLNASLPGPTGLQAWVRETVAVAKTDDKQAHLRFPEAAFLNGKALPILFDVLIQRGLSKEQARKALLNESHGAMPEISQQSPVRWEGHPFTKALGGSPSEIYRGWTNPEKSHPLAQSCPDFSLRDPFPHSILFEGKYFPGGSLKVAQKQLVTGIYEAFFYRGLPGLAATEKHSAGWGYDYACLMAYDASTLGTLRSAWIALAQQTRQSFWEGANLYVMILRGFE